jgi:metal-responsive CopG/Arc/MetJ family transcriptional regulator
LAQKVRYTIDLTKELNEELDTMADDAGITKSELFRRALGLYKVTDQARRAGESVGVGKQGEKSLSRVFVAQ